MGRGGYGCSIAIRMIIECGNQIINSNKILTHSYRKFWREMLPRIKYRNPAIPIQISRHTDPAGPSLLHIYTATKGSQAAQNAEPTHTINIRDQMESEILEALVAKTGAQEIKPTEQELQEMREIAEAKERSEKDRVEVREKLLKVRREEELLKLARGEIPATN